MLDEATRRVEDLLLRVRLAEGLDLASLDDHQRAQVGHLVGDGLATSDGRRLVLTRPGRLLADAVVRRLVP